MLDTACNNLLVDMAKFSAITCSDGRFAGVETECDTCGNTFNSCLRNSLINALFTAHALVERRLGYDITPRFHFESQPWDGSSRIQTLRPGLKNFAVREKINDVSGTSLYPVSPYIIEDAPIIDSEDGYCIVQLDRNIVDNPNSVTLRNGSGAKIEPDNRFGFPRRTVTDWELALPSTQYPTPCDTGTINVQHCKYVAVVTELKTVEDGEVVPVYPGTNQKIPQARPSELVGDTEIRYWFHVWDLVDPAFFDEGVSWINGEFYKILDNIELKNFTSEAAPITVTYRDLCCGDTRFATMEFADFKIIDNKNGIIELYKDLKPCSTCPCFDDCKKIMSVSYSYETSPEYFFTDFGETIANAITYLIAAELPLEVCKCEIKIGFLHIAQEAYTKVTVNPFTGTEIHNLEHGNLYGQVVFSEEMTRVVHYRRAIRL